MYYIPSLFAKTLYHILLFVEALFHRIPRLFKLCISPNTICSSFAPHPTLFVQTLYHNPPRLFKLCTNFYFISSNFVRHTPFYIFHSLTIRTLSKSNALTLKPYHGIDCSDTEYLPALAGEVYFTLLLLVSLTSPCFCL